MQTHLGIKVVPAIVRFVIVAGPASYCLIGIALQYSTHRTISLLHAAVSESDWGEHTSSLKLQMIRSIAPRQVSVMACSMDLMQPVGPQLAGSINMSISKTELRCRSRSCTCRASQYQAAKGLADTRVQHVAPHLYTCIASAFLDAQKICMCLEIQDDIIWYVLPRPAWHIVDNGRALIQNDVEVV